MEITEENIKLTLMLLGLVLFLKSISIIFNIVVIVTGIYTFMEVVFPEGLQALVFYKNQIENTMTIPGRFDAFQNTE